MAVSALRLSSVVCQMRQQLGNRGRFDARWCSSSTKQPVPQSTNPVPPPAATTVNMDIHRELGTRHRPTNLHKKILVHFKFYPSVEAVPKEVSFSQMTKAMSMARIKISISLMIAGLLLCFVTILYGRKHRYETSMVEVNKRRHEAYKTGEDFHGGRRSLILDNTITKKTQHE